VGTCGHGADRVSISEDGLNFRDFARLFRDHLKCPDALFLDGGRGVGIYNPEMGRNDWPWHSGYGPCLAWWNDGSCGNAACPRNGRLADATVSRAGSGLFRRRGLMVPKIDGRQWDDLDIGCTAYFESTVKAVLHEATIMRIV
jgi:hypothetical protein